MRLLLPIFMMGLPAALPAADIERIWLTHRTTSPTDIVVNWETTVAGTSSVDYGGAADALNEHIFAAEETTLHHVEIPLGAERQRWFYRVRTGADSSQVYSFQGYPADELRVAVVADTGYTKGAWGDAVLAVHPHLLLSAGDNVPALHSGQPVPPETTVAYSKLVDRWPQLYRSTPWLPALGNHDREIRPRGPQPPPEPVYDVEATAFQKFFELPEPEWHWHFDVPRFGVRLVAADLSHLSDMGSTWQTCHPYAVTAEQYKWYSELMEASRQPFLITLYNERNSQVRGLEKGAWMKAIQRGSLALTGFGYFAERAEVDGFAYYNTSVSGTGAKYPDPRSAFFASEDNFLLLTFRHAPLGLRVEVRNLEGKVLDAKDFAPRAGK